MRWHPYFAALLIAAAGAAPAHAAFVPDCAAAGFSPNYRADATVFCAFAPEEYEVRLAVSTNRGRSWRPVGIGPLCTGCVALAVIFSPRFTDDRTMYIGTSGGSRGGGTYVSHDGGASFTLSDAYELITQRNFTPFFSPAAPGGVGFAVAPASTIGAYLTYPAADPLSRPVLGAPTQNLRFLARTVMPGLPGPVAISPEYKANLEDRHIGWYNVMAYDCTVDFYCARPLFEFPDSWTIGSAGPLAGDGEYLVTRQRSQTAVRIYRSRDVGHTWTRWSSLEAFTRPSDGISPISVDVSVAPSPDVPRRLFAHLLVVPDKDKMAKLPIPASQILRSDDDGATWRRVAFSLDPRQPGKNRGTLPWRGAGTTREYGAVTAWMQQLPGGVLAAIAPSPGRGDHAYLYCSRDLGVRWTRNAC